ncbi:MAG: DUF4249 domain-containing protein [Maribacter sp.]|nr:DUF4249 domain-containing protein [Maribacter sp.]
MGRIGYKYILPCFLLLLQTNCTEPFIVGIVDFENFLVVEGTITTEMKQQGVKLSRTISLEDFEENVEDNATVTVQASDGNTFSFSQDSATGVYLSNEEFRAMQNIGYILKISDENGNSYTSKEVFVPPVVEIDEVYTELVSDEEKEGIQVFVDSDNETGGAKHFRYEYEETYQIKVPTPSSLKWEIRDYDLKSGLYEIDLSYRTPEIVCYSSNRSKGILQTTTSNLAENKVLHFPIRFILSTNSVLRERHSILAKQYVQSLEAHTFYKTVKDLGIKGNVLSQGQPGFVQGNLVSVNDPDERVMGFFEASSLTTKRIYFNYKDFVFKFPPYFIECDSIYQIPNKLLIERLQNENYQIINWGEVGPVKEYIIVNEKCTDCTTFSSKTKPDFWEDGP